MSSSLFVWYEWGYFSRLKRPLPLLSRFFIFSFELFFSVLSDESLSSVSFFFTFFSLGDEALLPVSTGSLPTLALSPLKVSPPHTARMG